MSQYLNKLNFFISKALEQAKIALAKGEVPVGCVIVKDEQIIAYSYNQNLTLKDPTAHSEILAIKQASQLLQSHRLDECDLYCTLEPCAMCAGAISLARIRRLYYCAEDNKSGGVTNGAKVFSHPQCHHKPEVYGGFAVKNATSLLSNFFIGKRLNKE